MFSNPTLFDPRRYFYRLPEGIIRNTCIHHATPVIVGRYNYCISLIQIIQISEEAFGYHGNNSLSYVLRQGLQIILYGLYQQVTYGLSKGVQNSFIYNVSEFKKRGSPCASKPAGRVQRSGLRTCRLHWQ